MKSGKRVAPRLFSTAQHCSALAFSNSNSRRQQWKITSRLPPPPTMTAVTSKHTFILFSCIVFDIKMHSRVELEVAFCLSRSPYVRCACTGAECFRTEFDHSCNVQKIIMRLRERPTQFSINSCSLTIIAIHTIMLPISFSLVSELPMKDFTMNAHTIWYFSIFFRMLVRKYSAQSTK